MNAGPGPLCDFWSRSWRSCLGFKEIRRPQHRNAEGCALMETMRRVRVVTFSPIRLTNRRRIAQAGCCTLGRQRQRSRLVFLLGEWRG